MMIERTCQTCGKKYLVPHWRSESKYCSAACRQIGLHAKLNVVCPCCGKHFHLKESHIKRYKGLQGFYCSKECNKMGMRIRMTGEGNHQYGLKGELNASYKGSETKHKNHKNVDIYVYCKNHPYADRNGRVAAHRLLVEENYRLFNKDFFITINGRIVLKKEYCVHHVNGNHDDNSINNLMVVTKSQHIKIHNKSKMIIRDHKTGRITGVVKLGELLENPEVDNQQPSFGSNTIEGSETNSRLLFANAKESNADTSAQHLTR